MKEKTLPSFRELETALNKTALKLHPSQVHGLVCGILCGHTSNRTAAWEELITGGKESGKTHELLQALYDVSAKQLEEFLFEFQLVLPGGSDELPQRAEALTLWCQGILTGLKLAQIPIIDRDPSEITEAIDDLIEIAKMNYEEVIASEEDETAYVELVEYVRMAVILIYQDMHEKTATSNTVKSTNHLH
jgi:uncharacterized protein YgfB (UPF0149 family)